MTNVIIIIIIIIIIIWESIFMWSVWIKQIMSNLSFFNSFLLYLQMSFVMEINNLQIWSNAFHSEIDQQFDRFHVQ